MRHTDFRDKNSTFNIISDSKSITKVFKFTIDEDLELLNTLEATEIANYYTTAVSTPNEDCFLLLKSEKGCSIIRVGNPDILVVAYAENVNLTLPYKQLSSNDGAKLDEGNLTEIGEGFYYIKPASYIKSFFDLGNGILKTLVVPYKINATATNKGTIRLESDRFELIAMPIKNKKVSEYFMQKIEEVTGKSADESIELVKAYPSNSVSSGKWMVFVPNVTKETNINNFKLVEDDNGTDAIVPFLVKTKVLDESIVIDWDSADGDS